MATSTEDLNARVERLEQLLEGQEMVRPSESDVHRFWARIPFGAWLKISGPTFAVMALGFALVWNAQQATTQQILDLQESTTARILEVQDRILDLERTTTDRILAVQDRILEMQQQILDLHGEARSERG